MPALADRIQITCGGRVVDINRSVQHFFNCGEVGSSHSGSYQPMRRALSHLRVTGDSSRVAPAPCLLCRSPMGFWSRECLRIATSLCVFAGFRMVIATAWRVALTETHDAAQTWRLMRPQPFMHHYGTDRAAVARAAFNELVTRARLADDAQAVVSAYTWSAMLVPFIWSASCR